MIRIVEGYDGSDKALNEEIAELVNEFRFLEIPSLYSPTTPEDVAEWFRDGGSNCLAYLGSYLSAIAFLYEVSRYVNLWIALDPRIPSYVVGKLVEWGLREKVRRGFRKPLRVLAGYEASFVASILEPLLSSYVVSRDATLMRLSGPLEAMRVPEGYVVREARPSDASAIAEVYNEAFSSYPWFRKVEASRFEEQLGKEGTLCFVALRNDRVVGFSMGRVYRALDGELSGYVSLLAVSARHRGRGLGRYLLSVLVREMLRKGVDAGRIFLDSVEGLERYYASMGFVAIREYVSYLLPYP